MIEQLKHDGRWILVRRTLWGPDDSLHRKPARPYENCWNGRDWCPTLVNAQHFSSQEEAASYLRDHRQQMRG